MPTTNTEVTLTEEEIDTILRKELKLSNEYKISWKLKNAAHSKYDDYRDGPGLTVECATFTKKS